jgi:pimeloyl-ACP methyl ester carboxylesterase
MGSFIARRVAEMRPERVARLMLIGSAVKTANDVILEVQEAVKGLEDPLPLAFVREFQSSTVHVPLPDEFLDGIVAESLKAPARVWRSSFEGILAFDDADRLKDIAASTLVLFGEKDALFSREEHEQLTAAIPDARLTEYQDTGHSLQWERPERVASDLDAFLREA